MDAGSGSPFPVPKSLKTLASNVRFSRGNTILHQFVLDNSHSKKSRSESYVNAALLSMSDVDVNAMNALRCTALHVAVMKENFMMVRKLLSCLPDIDVNKRIGRYANGDVALHMAAESNHILIIQELLKKGAYVNIRNRDGDTALSMAARSGYLDIMKLLVSQGADVNHKRAWGFTALHYAAGSENLEAVQFLISSGADLSAVGSYDKTPLHVAAEAGHSAVVKLLVSNGADLYAEDMCKLTPLCAATMSGDLPTVEYLLSMTPLTYDLHAANRKSPLALAAQHGHLDIFKLFLERVPNVNVNCLLLDAAASGSLEAVQFLIDNGADVNTRDENVRTPLHRAMEWPNNLATVEFLVGRGADVYAEDKWGKTLLHSAVRYCGNIKVAKFLTDQGVYLNATDKEGKTPLHDAVCRNNLRNAEWLIRKGAFLNVRDREGRTPMHEAVTNISRVSIEITKLLIEKGANVDTIDIPKNFTPLHYLVRNHEDYDHRNEIREKIRLLLQANADVYVQDKYRKSPLCYAILSRNKALVKLFLEKISRVKFINKSSCIINNSRYSAMQ